MNVAILYEYSGVVRQAFLKRGANVWSCDLLPAEDGGLFHVRADALWFLKSRRWDLVIAHPPCTWLCRSGCRWLHTRQQLKDGALSGFPRWLAMRQSAEEFNELFKADVRHIAIENPRPNHYAQMILPEFSQIIRPNWFGHPESKETCLWLKNLPPLMSTKHVAAGDGIHRMSPGKNRGHLRSKFFDGIADAMADQWLGFIRAA